MLKSLFGLLLRCYRLSRPYGRYRLVIMLTIAFINGAFQLIGVSSVFPFFALASDPAAFRASRLGQQILSTLPDMSDNRLLALSGAVAIALLLASSLITLANEVARSRYANGFGHWLRCKVVANIASRPYGYFLQRNTGSLLQKVLNDVWSLVQNVFLPLTEVISRIVSLFFLMLLILLLQPGVALWAALGFGLFYFVVFRFVRPRAQQIGKSLKQHNLGLFISAQQMMTGIKPMIVHGKLGYFRDVFKHHSATVSPLHSRLTLYTHGPRYMVEPIAFGTMVGLVVLLSVNGQSFASILPQLAVAAFTGYRILPTVQTLYALSSSITANAYTLAEVEVELRDVPVESRLDPLPADLTGDRAAIPPLSRAIRLEGVHFSYPGTSKPVLRDVHATFICGASTAIIGTTGSGKSTLVDIILGLHTPTQGSLMVDDTSVTPANVASWRAQVGYVPQDIFLLDASVAANIAFGIPEAQIDTERLRKAAKSAQILDFVEGELKDKFQTVVGERGTRLSGGQRQRIGLARALYHEPSVLILDEATNALDPETEEAVMNTIAGLKGQMTIILITHRLSTLTYCDHVIKMEEGGAHLAAHD